MQPSALMPHSPLISAQGSLLNVAVMLVMLITTGEGAKICLNVVVVLVVLATTEEATNTATRKDMGCPAMALDEHLASATSIQKPLPMKDCG